MTAYRTLYFLAIFWMMVAIGLSVSIAQTSTENASFSPPTTSDSASASDGSATPATPSVHKTSHKKKKKAVASAANGAKTNSASTTTAAKTGAKTTAKTTAGNATTGAKATASSQTGAKPKAVTGKKTAAKGSSKKKNKSKLAKTPTKPAGSYPIPADTGLAPSTPITIYPTSTPPAVSNSATAPVTVGGSSGGSQTQITISAPAPVTHPANGPEVETGLPVARHSEIASTFPVSPAISTLGSYVPTAHVKIPVDNFVFTNFRSHPRNNYPWKMGIYTTIFWIGEGGTTISSTDNVESAWDQDWRSNNGGSDTPNDREGYMPANHAARMNPFYVALPFNDLAFPDKARRWLPAGWTRPPKDGKQVSACKDRWVEIKNEQGETCYAQWEDVGPLRYDHAEYVFGDERPDTLTHAGLDVSPAVADYLNINGKNCMTRWRFVDDADVPPGYWLKYDEEALIFKAMHDIKDEPDHVLPIQRATAPIDDENDSDAAKRRINAAKG